MMPVNGHIVLLSIFHECNVETGEKYQQKVQCFQFSSKPKEEEEEKVCLLVCTSLNCSVVVFSSFFR